MRLARQIVPGLSGLILVGVVGCGPTEAPTPAPAVASPATKSSPPAKPAVPDVKPVDLPPADSPKPVDSLPPLEPPAGSEPK